MERTTDATTAALNADDATAVAGDFDDTLMLERTRSFSSGLNQVLAQLVVKQAPVL